MTPIYALCQFSLSLQLNPCEFSDESKKGLG